MQHGSNNKATGTTKVKKQPDIQKQLDSRK